MIYFIQSGENGPIKIGYTEKNVEKRFTMLQTGSAEKLFLIATAEGTREDEKKLHLRFRHLQMTGEWFRPEKDLMDFIIPCPEPTLGKTVHHPKAISFNLPMNMKEFIGDIEKRCVLQAMKAAEGNLHKAADLLRVSFRQFRYLRDKYCK